MILCISLISVFYSPFSLRSADGDFLSVIRNQSSIAGRRKLSCCIRESRILSLITISIMFPHFFEKPYHECAHYNIKTKLKEVCHILTIYNQWHSAEKILHPISDISKYYNSPKIIWGLIYHIFLRNHNAYKHKRKTQVHQN